MNKKIITLIVIVVVTVVGAISYCFTNYNSVSHDSESISYNPFPNKIGKYFIYETSGKKFEVMDMCRKIEDNTNLKDLGAGDVCMKTWVASYTQLLSSTTATTTYNLIRVSLSKVTSGKEAFSTLIDRTAKKTTLNDHKTFQIAPFQMGWQSNSGFDVVVVEQGYYRFSAKTTTKEFIGELDKSNKVVQYFVSKYTPND